MKNVPEKGVAPSVPPIGGGPGGGREPLEVPPGFKISTYLERAPRPFFILCKTE